MAQFVNTEGVRREVCFYIMKFDIKFPLLRLSEIHLHLIIQYLSGFVESISIEICIIESFGNGS